MPPEMGEDRMTKETLDSLLTAMVQSGDGISDLVRAHIERAGIDAFGLERYRLRGAAHRSADAPSLGELSAREDGGRIAKAQDEEVHGPTRPSLDDDACASM